MIPHFDKKFHNDKAILNEYKQTQTQIGSKAMVRFGVSRWYDNLVLFIS